MEYAKYGDLQQYLFRPLRENIAKFIFLQILLSVETCHIANIVHRDLKPENIFICESFQIKLGDFGHATMKNESFSEYLTDYNIGTTCYNAPEINERVPYKGVSTDIFSLGVLLFTIISGGLQPFEKASIEDESYINIIKNDYDQFWDSFDFSYNLSEDLKDLINCMLAYDQDERFDIPTIKSSNWLESNIASKEEVVNELQRNKIRCVL